MKNCSGRSALGTIILIAVLAFCLRVAIQQAVGMNITQNESNARSTLKLISTALENYAKNNRGTFPSDLSVLTQTSPAYLDKDYTRNPSYKGYVYSCSRLAPLGYSCSAVPLKCKLSGRAIYTISTGGLFISEECNKNE